MIKINKCIEPVELTKYKQQPNASYRDMHGAPSGKSNSDGTPIDVYTIVLNRLIQEQGCICAYCMCRIPEKGKKATIEHIDPQSATSEEKALDYRTCLLYVMEIVMLTMTKKNPAMHIAKMLL